MKYLSLMQSSKRENDCT